MWAIPSSNPEGKAFMILVLVFLVLAVLSFGIRIYSRRINKNVLDASDYFCSLAVGLCVGLTIILWGAFSHGWGEDVTHFTQVDARFAAWTFIAIDIVWNGATVCVRISMLLLYIRLFNVRGFRLICWATIALNFATFLAVVLATCLICRPITYSFDKSSPNGECGDLVHYELFTAVMSLVLDALIVALPMPMLWRLQMKTTRKVGISIVLSMGAIICALTLARILASQYYYLQDYTKQAAFIALITGLEPTIGVINACLPFFPLVVKQVSQTRMFKNATASIRSISKKNNKGHSASNGFVRFKEMGPKGKIHDVEMNPIKGVTYGKNYVSTGSQNSIPESGPWNDPNDSRRQNHILVRKDFSVE